jgi:hypothetical protein
MGQQVPQHDECWKREQLHHILCSSSSEARHVTTVGGACLFTLPHSFKVVLGTFCVTTTRVHTLLAILTFKKEDPSKLSYESNL